MPFEPGKSGNPEGRPKNIPNRTTLAMRQRIETEADPVGFLIRVMRGDAVERPQREGDEPALLNPTLEQSLSAARILTAKLAPDAKDRPVAFDVGEINGPPDALRVAGRLVAAMSQGDLTPSEAAGVMDVIGGYLDAWKTDELDARLKALEEKAA